MKTYIMCVLIESSWWYIYNEIPGHLNKHNRKVQPSCGEQQDPDQPVHLRSLVRIFATVNILKFYTPKFQTEWHMQSANPDQTAPEGAVRSGSTLFAIQLRPLKKQWHRKPNLGKKVWNNFFQIFRTFTVFAYIDILWTLYRDHLDPDQSA